MSIEKHFSWVGFTRTSLGSPNRETCLDFLHLERSWDNSYFSTRSWTINPEHPVVALTWSEHFGTPASWRFANLVRLGGLLSVKATREVPWSQGSVVEAYLAPTIWSTGSLMIFLEWTLSSPDVSRDSSSEVLISWFSTFFSFGHIFVVSFVFRQTWPFQVPFFCSF